MKISFPRHDKEQAFKQLYEEYYAPFCLYAKRFIEDKEAREDIVSDVFASLWDKIDSFELDSDTTLGYIKMCVKNSCLNYLSIRNTNGTMRKSSEKKHLFTKTNPTVCIHWMTYTVCYTKH